MSITIYSKPSCPQCSGTYRALDKQGLEYESIDVTQDSEALAFIKGLGYQQAPVVYVDKDTHWSGYRPDRVKDLAQEHSELLKAPDPAAYGNLALAQDDWANARN